MSKYDYLLISDLIKILAKMPPDGRVYASGDDGDFLLTTPGRYVLWDKYDHCVHFDHQGWLTEDHIDVCEKNRKSNE